jgi:hypothetical protein
MLKDIARYYINNGNCIITSAPNNGATSFALFLANSILENSSNVIFYNPMGDIDRNFVKQYYPNVYKNCTYFKGPTDLFLLYLDYMQWEFDYIFIDPADCLMNGDKKTLHNLVSLSKANKFKIIVTSQIRQDPSQGGKVYSTLETLKIFDYSIWIRNVTEQSELFKSKYVDVYGSYREGNKYIARNIAKFTDQGNIIDS